MSWERSLEISDRGDSNCRLPATEMYRRIHLSGFPSMDSRTLCGRLDWIGEEDRQPDGTYNGLVCVDKK